MDLNQFVKIRKYLHQNPELSGSEINTADYIVSFLEKLNPDVIKTEIGGYGIAAIFNGTNPECTIGFRAELDALPIKEINNFDYISKKKGISHKCGHDGHMVNLLAFASMIADNRASVKNNIMILFQPAEETAQGAKAMLKDSKFKEILPDYMFALHNLPGYPLGSVILKNNVFASASTGLIIELNGKTSHAAHPENGINPVLAMTNIINGLISIPSLHTGLSDAANITVIHSRLGEIAFGTSPGEAVIMATLRAHKNEVMDILKNKSIEIARKAAESYSLELNIKWVEDFLATVNNDDTYNAIFRSAEKLNYEIININNPFPWSEDFGFFSENIKTGFFGLGAGDNHPQLHNPDYDYPDELIEKAGKIFNQIVQHYN